MEDTKILKRKMLDLASNSFNRNLWEYSKFLNISEQSEVQMQKYPVKYHFFGGYENAERNIAVFGNDDFGYEPSYPISFVEIAPVNKKFADNLSHRDFLGSLMSLGINREMIGDILVNDNAAVIICVDSVAEYIVNEIDNIKHTTVKCKITDSVPVSVMPEFDEGELIVSSERIDVLISAVYNMSRNNSQLLIVANKVFCDGREVLSASFVPTVNQIISVRGYGRFVYCGAQRATRKNRIVINIKKYKT